VRIKLAGFTRNPALGAAKATTGLLVFCSSQAVSYVAARDMSAPHTFQPRWTAPLQLLVPQ
jgi:hypothetical protein